MEAPVIIAIAVVIIIGVVGGLYLLHFSIFTTNTNPQSQQLNASNHISPAAVSSYAYVANSGSNSISVINTSVTQGIIADININSSPNGIALSPGGNELYVANGDNVSVYNTQTDSLVKTIVVGGTGGMFGSSLISGLAVSSNGKLLYALDENSGTVDIINISNSYVINRVSLGSDLYLPSEIVITPNGQEAYITDTVGNVVSALNLSNGFVQTIGLGGPKAPQGITITPNGKYVYVADSASDFVSVINTSSNTLVENIRLYGKPWSVAITPNGEYVYVSYVEGYSENVSVINTATNTVVMNISATEGSGLSSLNSVSTNIAVAPDGKEVFVSNSQDGVVTGINTVTNTVSFYILTNGSAGSLEGIIVSPDSKLVYVADGSPSSVFVINASIGSALIGTFNVQSPSGSLAITPNGEKLYVAGPGSSVYVLNPATGAELSTINLTKSIIDSYEGTNFTTTLGAGNPTSIAITPNGNYAYITTGVDNSVYVINTATDTIAAKIGFGKNIIQNLSAYNATYYYYSPEGGYATSIVMSPNGARIYVLNEYNRTIYAIDPSTNTVVDTIKFGGSNNITDATLLAIAPDGKYLYVGENAISNSNSSILVINTSNGAVIKTINLGYQQYYGLVVSPNGKNLYTTSPLVVNLDSGAVTRWYTILPGSAIAQTQNGRYLYIPASYSNVVELVDTSDDSLVAEISIGTDPSGIIIG